MLYPFAESAIEKGREQLNDELFKHKVSESELK